MRGMTKFGWLISEPFGFVTSQPRLNLSQASLWAQHWDKAWQLGMGSKEAASKYFSIVFVFLYYCINISLLFIIVILYFCISISLLEWRDLLKIWGRRLSAFVEEWGKATFTFTTSWHHAMLRHLLSFVCDPQYCVHIQSQVTTAFHSHCIWYLFKISPATFTKKDVHSHRKVYSYTNHFPTLDAHAMMLSS